MYSLRIYMYLHEFQVYKHLKEKQRQCHESRGSWSIGRKSMKELYSDMEHHTVIDLYKWTKILGQ